MFSTFPSLKMPQSSEASQRAALWLTLTLAFLFVLRPGIAFRPSWGGVDDECYKDWLLRLLGANEALCRSQSYFPGIALLWLPAGAIAKFIFSQSGGSLRNLTAVAVGLTSFFSWASGLWILAGLIRRRGQRLWALDGILFTLSVPVLYYATSRTALVHAGEFFLGTTVLWALDRKQLGVAAALATWLTLTRLNDAPVFLLLLGTMADRGKFALFFARLRKPGWSALACAFLVAVGFFLFDLTFVGGYNKVPLIWHVLRFRLERVGEVLWGSDWGLLWTAPFWLLCFTYGTLRWRQLSWTSRGAVVWMALGLALCHLWPGNGSDFAYRYLIGSYVAAFWIWRDTSLFFSRGTRAVLALNGLWLTLLTVVYQTSPRLHPQRHWAGWITPNFQWEALKALRDITTYEVALSKSAIAFTLISLRSTSSLVPHLLPLGEKLSPAVRLTTTAFAIVLFLTLLAFLFQIRPRRNHG